MPTTDFLGLASSINMTLGAYFYNTTLAVENKLANKTYNSSEREFCVVVLGTHKGINISCVRI